MWYGGGHNGEGDWLFRKGPRPRRLGFQTGTTSALAGGYTVPNSSCPVCGASVFYYESPYGGRVFFDSLGPPWPKHPCTSGDDRIRSARQHASWHTENWHPLTSVTIDAHGPTGSLYRMTGQHAGRSYTMHFSAPEIVMAEIVRVRRVGAGEFELSILDYNAPERAWCSWSGRAFVTDSHALRASGLHKAIIHSHPAPEAKVAPIPKGVLSASTPAPATPPHPPLLIGCPDCTATLKAERLLRHLRLVHGYIPLGSISKFTGRLLVHRQTHAPQR